MSANAKVLLRAAEIESMAEGSFQHPLNPRSEIHLKSLSQIAGMKRVGVHIGRIPPGKESFAYHSHHFEEEFLYILVGRGMADIDGQEVEVGPGDFLGFPAPSVAHHLRNPFDQDLVYMMGGERREFEIADFPRNHKRLIRNREKAWFVDVGDLDEFELSDVVDES